MWQDVVVGQVEFSYRNILLSHYEDEVDYTTQ